MPPKKKTFQAGDRVQFRLRGYVIRATVLGLEVKSKKCRIQADTPGAGEVELPLGVLEASS